MPISIHMNIWLGVSLIVWQIPESAIDKFVKENLLIMFLYFGYILPLQEKYQWLHFTWNESKFLCKISAVMN